MPSTLEEDEQNGLLALFKGEAGTGKTVAALSFPNIYVFDFDRKMPSIAKKHYPGKDIHYDRFETTLEVDLKLSHLKNECPYETIIIDSYTGLGKLVQMQTAWQKGEIGSAIFNLKRGKKRDTWDYYTNTVQYIGHFIDQIKLLHMRHGLPRHVLITAHVIRYEGAPDLIHEDKEEKVTEFRSILCQGRKSAAILPTEVDNMFIFGLKKNADPFADQKYGYFCTTVSFGEDAAKCSWDFPEVIDITNEPLYGQLFCKQTTEKNLVKG
jgi:hypothetical protein